MSTPPRAPGLLRRLFAAPALSEPERARVAVNVRVSLLAGIVGSGLGLLANALSERTASTVPLAALALALVLAQLLVRRGRVGAAVVLAQASIVLAIDWLLVLGQGIHDRAALLLPVVVLMAGLTFDRRVLVGTTATCVASAGTVTHLENLGVIGPSAFLPYLGWLPLVDVTIILVVTAVAVDLLVSDVRRSMRDAREKGDRLAESNRELEARNAELERFAYVVSHDLKSPLVTIRGFLDYVERDARGGRLDRLADDLDRIRAASGRMSRLLDDVLELSRTGRLARPHQDLDLADVVREARALVEGRFSERGVRLDVEEPLPVVHGDRQGLVDLVQNLLDNAAKFMGDQPQPLVRVSCRPGTDGFVEVTVSDNGVGIDPAHHEAVFEIFRQLDPRQEGTGLGLALARRIVETHGGRITVESEGGGRGAALRFTLPAGGSV
jgi:signal transduction histidine kinase